MSALPQTICTREEYLAMEESSPTKHEFCRGEILAMAGASSAHCEIATNLLRELSLLLKGKKCSALGSDQRVKVEETDLYFYPDALVACRPRQIEPNTRPETLLNPVLIAEILSPSTESYDRGAKFAHYRRIASLREILFIASLEPRVEHYVRQPDGRWLLHGEQDNLSGGIRLTSVEGELALAEIYDKVEFPPRFDIVREI